MRLCPLAVPPTTDCPPATPVERLFVIVFVVRVKPVENVSASSFAFHVAALEMYASAMAVPCQVPVAMVPRDVSDELTTVAFKVVPVSVPAAAVTVPLAPSDTEVPLMVTALLASFALETTPLSIVITVPEPETVMSP